ncbi:hypothetical protein HK103_006805 [Boothiomyces macroporosus]|uniref:Glycosyltransferase n=1 Tax=Boothiomyces macroporosus TaxID=261099 RepID=A0AAD5UD96_9FUNG|nr:hypothetical protein HK103_006805 [Boothiomyces macroporosus]
MKLTADFNFYRNIPADKKPLPASHCYSDPLEDQYNAVTMDSNQTYHYIMNMCSNYTEASYRSCKVPKIVHLVPGRRFKFHHYLNIKAIKKIIKPDRIYVHGEIFPFSSKFFMDAVHEFDLDLVLSRTITSTFSGQPIEAGEHKADLIRMEALIRYGGIYLDMDAFPIKRFDRFLDDEFSIGYQNQEEDYGLNNGIMISKKCSRFALKWYEEYKSFDPQDWDHHSVKLPLKIYRNNTELAKAYRHELVSWWSWDKNWKELPMFKPYDSSDWLNVYAVHSFYRLYAGNTPFPINFQTVKNIDNSFGRFARHVLYNGPAM